ncbi:AAA family ATPase [Pseudoxanthomonas sp. JBR18]|uniref:ATP-dependent nuclease n=1 Tax=Pseudoxanthomonas sp. JBR18 TaxID=2969308 RepID=UPI0023058007|nr:AAA family ATPase [Pseudoxanthomonas sp. JBR18]WCE05598.1 AAA family ATPase [Pseudoxanthomonas sp. JBR18]
MKGYSCFTGDWCGFDKFVPITVIIGRNNTGKSQLLNLVRNMCEGSHSRQAREGSFLLEGIITEDDLRPFFPRHHSGGAMNGDHWSDNGLFFVDTPVKWSKDSEVEILETQPRSTNVYGNRVSYHPGQGALHGLKQALSRIATPFDSKRFLHLMADRDIRPEIAESSLKLWPDGRGATNIIRDHLINAGKISVSRPIIQNELRKALSQIFGPDGEFLQIFIQQHDQDSGAASAGQWEVFLEEQRKGLIPLTNSGSGLKTVILVLLNLLLIPKIENRSPSDYVFAFEELENNLHPSLLRRLLKFIDAFTQEHQCFVFFTTHSSATLDLFSRAEHAQFVRISHDGESASTQTIDKFFDRAHVLGELGAKASDILQANGIIWVEGPSDAIYINHWIEIFSGGELLEGRDYACAFYGGSLLARTTLAAPGAEEDGLINLIPLNRNVALICDSDRSSSAARLKPRVRKAQHAVKNIPNAAIWITAGKEIESYLPGAVLSAALGKPSAADPDQYALFFPSTKKAAKGKSYLESELGLQAVDKVELAIAARPHMTKEVMENRLDWGNQMIVLTNAIRKWNE